MLYSTFAGHAARRPDAPAVIEHERPAVSYRRLLDTVDAQRSGLLQRGVSPGDIVVTRLSNSADYIALVLALAACGAVHCPVDVNAPAATLVRRTRHVGAAMVVSDDVDIPSDTGVPVVDPAWLASQPRARRDPEEHRGPYRVQETSGSTGEPSLALWRQDALLSEILNWVAVTRTSHDDVFYNLHSIDGGHGADLHVFPALLTGAAVALGPPDRPATAADLDAAGTTVLSALPEQYVALAEVAHPLPRVWLPMCGGGYLSDRVSQLVEQRLSLRPRRIYGSTEFGMILADLGTPAAGPLPPGLTQVGGAEGMTPPGDVQVKLQPIAGLPPDTGEIVALSDHCGSGLLGHPGSGARPGRWYRTGDVGRRTPDGGILPLARVGDAVASRAATLFAPQVEEALTSTDEVQEAVVLPTTDVVVVVAAPAPSASAEDAAAAVDRVLGELEVDASITIVGRLPRVATGKPDRRLLRARHTAAAAEGPVEE